MLAGGLACSLLVRNQETLITATTEKPNNYVDCSDFMDIDCRTFHRIDHDTSASIIGKWQLIKHRLGGRNVQCFDYCQHEIVYEFKPNGILTVSQNSGADIFLRVGDHPYSFVKGRFGYELKIDRFSNWYRINTKELVLDMHHHDGRHLYFTRIN